LANPIYELDPVTHITAGALGEPGHRTFFIQAERGLQRVDLLCEKQQVEALADAIDEMVRIWSRSSAARHRFAGGRGKIERADEPLFGWAQWGGYEPVAIASSWWRRKR
jgi:uncharacterized repeat protein (TIGR03847 family)